MQWIQGISEQIDTINILKGIPSHPPSEITVEHAMPHMVQPIRRSQRIVELVASVALAISYA